MSRFSFVCHELGKYDLIWSVGGWVVGFVCFFPLNVRPRNEKSMKLLVSLGYFRISMKVVTAIILLNCLFRVERGLQREISLI